MFNNNNIKLKGKFTLTKQGFSFPKEVKKLCLLLRYIHKNLIFLFVLDIAKLYCCLCYWIS